MIIEGLAIVTSRGPCRACMITIHIPGQDPLRLVV